MAKPKGYRTMVPAKKGVVQGMERRDIRFVIITGLSGAGKTQAIRILEDLGFFCVDNLPPTLLPKFAELCSQPGGRITRVALVIDIRGGEFFDSTFEALGILERTGFPYQILFLEANDDTLIRRFKETRRRHPLAHDGRILDGIAQERKRLEEIRGKANIIIDTSNVTPQGLKERILEIFSQDGQLSTFVISVISFGFKYGLPIDADLVFDVRFLPNPHYVDSLRPLNGLEPSVREYVLKWPIAGQFLDKLLQLLDFLIPHYINEGKTQLSIAVGCTGGQHRSIVVATEVAELLKKREHTVVVEHRDIGKTEARAQPE